LEIIDEAAQDARDGKGPVQVGKRGQDFGGEWFSKEHRAHDHGAQKPRAKLEALFVGTDLAAEVCLNRCKRLCARDTMALNP